MADLVRSFTILRGLLYASGFVALWTWIARTVRRYDGDISIPMSPRLAPIGGFIAIIGALFVLASLAAFLTVGRGTPAPFDPPREFVATGPYRYVRNPMYIGAALLILGGGLMTASPSIVLLSVAFILLTHTLVVFYEEPSLRRRFGKTYETYCSNVSRWRIRLPHS